jgi:hypothetical protein
LGKVVVVAAQFLEGFGLAFDDTDILDLFFGASLGDEEVFVVNGDIFEVAVMGGVVGDGGSLKAVAVLVLLFGNYKLDFGEAIFVELDHGFLPCAPVLFVGMGKGVLINIESHGFLGVFFYKPGEHGFYLFKVFLNVFADALDLFAVEFLVGLFFLLAHKSRLAFLLALPGGGQEGDKQQKSAWDLDRGFHRFHGFVLSFSIF